MELHSSHETGDLCRVHAGWVSYQAAFAILQVDSVKVALQRRDFRTLDDELFRVPVKTYDVLYKPGAGGESVLYRYRWLKPSRWL